VSVVVKKVSRKMAGKVVDGGTVVQSVDIDFNIKNVRAS
jgi:hypothetical protein